MSKAEGAAQRPFGPGRGRRSAGGSRCGGRRPEGDPRQRQHKNSIKINLPESSCYLNGSGLAFSETGLDEKRGRPPNPPHLTLKRLFYELDVIITINPLQFYYSSTLTASTTFLD